MFLGLFLADAGAELSYFGFLQPLIKLLKLRMKKMLSRGSWNRREFKFRSRSKKYCLRHSTVHMAFFQQYFVYILLAKFI